MKLLWPEASELPNLRAVSQVGTRSEEQGSSCDNWTASAPKSHRPLFRADARPMLPCHADVRRNYHVVPMLAECYYE